MREKETETVRIQISLTDRIVRRLDQLASIQWGGRTRSDVAVFILQDWTENHASNALRKSREQDDSVLAEINRLTQQL